jgi:chromosome segregation ATPase
VQNLADEAVQKLLATGQWTTESIPLSGVYSVYENGKIVKKPLEGYQDVLKPAGNNPFKGASTVTKKADTKQKTGRSGGGGGGSSKDKNDSFRDTNTTTEVEKMLDLMSQVNAIQQYQQSYYQSQNKYYSQTGQLQGVIAYMQKEKEVLEGQNGTLESNIKRIEEYMSAKQAELATLSTEDEKYKEVADDFDKLQKAHQTYTKQLIDNKSAVEALNQAMEEQRKKIRQMEIDLRNLILGAIEDR